MDDEKLAFEAMMNEIGDSDSDSEFDHADTKPPRVAQSKPQHNEHDYHQSKHSRKEESGHKSSNMSEVKSSSRGQSPALVSHNHSRNDMAMAKSNQDVEIENFGSKQNGNGMSSNRKDKAGIRSTQQSDYLASKNWLMRACHPHDPTTLCYMLREKNMMGGLTLRLFIEPKNDVGPKFVMSAKKFVKKRTSYYLISLLDEPEERGGDDIVGKVRANGVGSKYLITDHGLAPEKTEAPSMLRKEHGLLKFKFDPDSPSGMQVYVPKVNQNCVAVTLQPRSEEESMEECVERNETEKMISLVNKKPKWDATQKGHVLNFEGRVTKSSVKNFQLTVEGNEEVCLQFGRVDDDKFSMDVRYPLSLFQAFGLCIAAMDKKIADRQGYSFVQKIMGH
mmetsp:Transcript_9801/g.16289  ORF Transcript_9801/g.16289 Transcript_9801/m.16289 type:complete len:391 (-) Transcript_9801:144-1316(-)|eukprot:CAMPEP_0114429696 /NCGR_PEP_ID=MMETSP0103-20121206/9631_1 /TAXON_ID=37642 ORGANISM="Paraphysomonas imperforata, Strain PA2" /NCGR_SAMPLE_ID=MMETSP0103 /ASSEMBLY_ACC=CAM_ASM_000201 /LENGTH=390 /DNA_ID=CAMNT_0001599065 /DNA_START=49 /DNA_END=1221 /DNA_ORIENTATION=+